MRWLLLGLILVSLAWRLSILRTLDFDPDEMQHLHIAWCISEGLIPYRDFFEHHTPWMHFAIVPLLRCFPVATDPEVAVGFIFLMRILMVLCTAVILALVFLLGRLWRDARVGLVAAVLLVNEHLFLWKTLEIRPDVPGLALLLAAQMTLLGGLRTRSAELFLASGAILGGAVLCSLKTVFIGPAILLVLLLQRVQPRHLAAYATGFALPVLLTLAGFAAHGALADFLDGTLGVSARWKERFSPLPYFEMLSPGLALLAVAGFLRYFRRSQDQLIAFSFAGLVAGAFVISVPWAQYHLLYLPFGALLAAALLVDLTGPLSAVVALLLVAWPGWQMTRWPLQTNDHSLRQIRYVLEHSRPDETVLDGWMSRAPFRPHAYRYYFLNNEMRLFLPKEERRSFLFALEDGRIAPKLIMMDEHLELYCPEAVPFYHRFYRPTEVGPIWIRKEP